MEKFAAQNAYRTVQELGSPKYGGRRVGTPGHDRALEWIEERLNTELRVERHGFSFPLTVVDVVGRPAARIQPGSGKTLRPVAYRRDFAEHPSSGTSRGHIEGALTTWGASPRFRGRWVVAATQHGSPSLKVQASAAADGGGVGLLVPFSVNIGAVIFKQLFAGDPFSLPTLFFRRELLGPSLPSKLETDVRIRRVPLKGTNLVAKLPGSDPSLADQPLIVGAHYDAVGDDPCGFRFPGASDNASGLAVVLEISRTLRKSAPGFRRPVWFAAFDAEETGAYGSRALADELQHSGIQPLVVNVDLAALAHNPVMVEGSANSRSLFAALDTSGRRHRVPLVQGPVQSDNRQFAALGFASVGLGSGGIGYHTPLDTVDRVEPQALRRIGVLLLDVIRGLAG